MSERIRLRADASKRSRLGSVDRRSDEPQRRLHAGPALVGTFSASDVLRLQHQVGNQAVQRLLIQRQFEDEDKIAEGAVGHALPEPAASSVPKPERVDAFGQIDGSISSNVAPHAFTDDGKTGVGTWHHCAGGTGGRGNQNTADAQLVAPVYKSSVSGGQGRAWIKKGTGTIKVKRSYTGVTHGNQGAYNPSPATIWMSPRAQARMDKHERKHIEKTKELHDTYIKPLEDRISTFRGLIKAKKAGATPGAAVTALQTQIDWNTAINDFANNDTAQNQPGGPVDTTDQATADFYTGFPTSAAFQTQSGCDTYVGIKGQASKKGKT
jgi:hypothetical protein